jgi:hypothetical protein
VADFDNDDQHATLVNLIDDAPGAYSDPEQVIVTRVRPGRGTGQAQSSGGASYGVSLLKAASNEACGSSKLNFRRYVTASAAPVSRSMPASSHSTEMGPS